MSSRGYAFGYLGGGLLLILNLILFIMHDKFGIDGGLSVRICLASAGVWMAIFIPITLTRLRANVASKTLGQGQSVIGAGFRQLGETIRNARHYPQTLLFLAAYLLYNDGVQTVIALSSVFGTQELGMESQTLIITILMVQFVAWFGDLDGVDLCYLLHDQRQRGAILGPRCGDCHRAGRESSLESFVVCPDDSAGQRIRVLQPLRG